MSRGEGPDAGERHPHQMDETDDIGAAIRETAGRVRAPDALRARLAGERPARRSGRGRRAALAAACAAAAAVVVLILALPGGAPAGPSVADAADAALAAPQGPRPARVPGHDALAVSQGGVAFPWWQQAFGWRAVGAADERVGARDVTTVWYRDGRGRRLGYAIVAGAALDVPGHARRVGRFAVLQRDGATVAIWERGGHTCVLAAHDVDATELMRLAAWATY